MSAAAHNMAKEEAKLKIPSLGREWFPIEIEATPSGEGAASLVSHAFAEGEIKVPSLGRSVKAEG